MKMNHLFIAVAAACLPTSVVAATVTKSYTVTSTFGSGSVSNLIQSFAITYDPLITGGPITLANYYTSSNFAAFAAPVSGYVDYSGTNTNYRQLVFSPPLAGEGTQNGAYDFTAAFRIDDSGNIFDPSASVFYSYPGLNGIVQSTRAIATLGFAGPGAAVPELASWAMMIVGMGAIGGAMRRRQRTTIRFA